jgi:hypothetical protein
MYGSGIYNQQDATNSQFLLLAVLYMFRAFSPIIRSLELYVQLYGGVVVNFVFTVCYDLHTHISEDGMYSPPISLETHISIAHKPTPSHTRSKV